MYRKGFKVYRKGILNYKNGTFYVVQNALLIYNAFINLRGENRMNEDRKTRIVNSMLHSMLKRYCSSEISKYSFNAYMVILNTAYSAYYARRDNNNIHENDLKILEEDLTVRVKYSTLKKLSINKNVTKKEFDKITDSINILVDIEDYERVNLFRKTRHCDETQVLEVVFDEEFFELALLMVKKSTTLDISMFKKLRSKYEYYLYCKYCEFKKTGNVICSIEKLQDELSTATMPVKEINRKIDKALDKLSELGIHMQRENVKKGNKVTHIRFKFKPWNFKKENKNFI